MTNPKAYVSYSRTDVAWVSAFAQALSADGIDPWLDIWSVVPGSSIADQLEEALGACDVVVAVFSPDTPANPNVMFEVGAAVGAGKPYIPIVPDGTGGPGIPFSIASHASILRATPAETAAVVATAIKRRAAQPKKPRVSGSAT